MRNLNAITPETETTSHYFWAQAHDFALDDPTVTELLYRQIWTAFQEDLLVIGGQQGNIDHFGAALPDQDAGGIQARRIIDRILAEEAAGQPGAGANPVRAVS